MATSSKSQQSNVNRISKKVPNASNQVPNSSNKVSNLSNQPTKNIMKTTEGFFRKLVEVELIQDKKLTNNIFKSFILIGVFTKIMFGLSKIHDPIYGSYGPATISLWSYGIIILSFICIFFLKLIFSNNNNNKYITIFKSMNSIILIILLIWLISINLKHFRNINSFKVPDNFFIYEGFTSTIIIIHICFYIYNLGDNNDRDMKKKIEVIIWLLVFLNFFLILIQQLILDNFSVDIL
tara:strand:+ start:4246 stop:4956 length:711 start_codon:yes stop_codon:yes gene_type:complete